MTDVLRITVTRSDGKAFPKARVALQPLGDVAAPPFVEANASGQVTFPMVADENFLLTVTHPAATGGIGASPAWERNDTAYWPVSMKLGFIADQHVVVMQENPPQITYFGSLQTALGALLDVEVRLFRIRRIDEVARAVLHTIDPPNVEYPFKPPATPPENLAFSYSTQPLLGANGVARNIVVARRVMDERAPSLFEVAARKDASDKEEKGFAPKCVGVWMPRQVMRGGEVPPSVLIYFRPMADQDFRGAFPSFYPPPVPSTVTTKNFQLNRSDPQPYSKAQYYFDWFFRKTFEFVADPWKPAALFAMGFRNQVKASGRRVGIIAPIPEAGASGLTHGHAIEAGFMAELVAEILGFFDVEFDPGNSIFAPLRPAPAPGLIGALAHSNGNNVLSAFISSLRAAQPANLIKQKLREIYLLDPDGGTEGADFDNCAGYAGGLPPDEAALRCYTQNGFILGKFDDLHTAFGRTRPSSKPYDDTSEELPAGTSLKGLKHRTAAFLAAAAWPTPPSKTNTHNELHSMIPSTMLTHALLLSRFPKL